MMGEPYARQPAQVLNQKFPRLAASHTRKKNGYVLIPSFTYGVDWIGASSVRVQFDFTVSQPFTLFDFLPLINQPSSGTYSLCVRWRYGDRVVRYKLHSGDSEVACYYPDYQGETVPIHWVLEFWNQQGHNQIIVDEPCIIKLGMRYYPQSCHDNTDVLESVALRADDELMESIAPFAIPTSFNPVGAWFSAGSGVTAGDVSITSGDTTILAGDEG